VAFFASVNASSVCTGMISTGFGFVAFFASVNASTVCIRLSRLVWL